MSRKKHRPLCILLLLIIVLISSLPVSYAWLAISNQINMGITAEVVSAYFESGSGVYGDPYVITKAKHLYNLAWLQNIGKFETVTYFELGADIDVAGLLSGAGGTTGAIPPIGTDDNPFMGVFNGNGYVIKNLWVSSDPGDWKEKPSGLELETFTVGTNIGFFGQVGPISPTPLPSTPPSITNFYLENIEVTSHVSASNNVGILAGYANCNLSEIGIKNGKISLKNNTLFNSDYTLIGKLGDSIEWTVQPSEGTGGGHLEIDPSATDSNGNLLFTGITGTGNYAAVAESSPGSAYYIARLDATGVSGGAKSFKSYLPEIDEALSGTVKEVTIDTSPDLVNMTESIVGARIWQISKMKPIPYIFPRTKPLSSTTTAITLPNSTTLNVPSNGIWFKPSEPGTCLMAITKTNNSGPASLSLYSYKRGTGGAITDWRETKIVASSNLGNKLFLTVKVKIFQESIDEDREYVIGLSSTASGGDAGFTYLILAGAGNTGGSSGSGGLSPILGVDFVYNTYTDLGDANYTPNHTLLKIQNPSSAQFNGTLCFNMDWDSTDNRYYVFFNNNTLVSDRVTTDSDSKYDADPNRYDDRDNTLPNST
jgi:hypothetical protein